MITILADDRESDARVSDELRKFSGVTVLRQRLPIGDYIAERHLIIERKTQSDLSVSIIDGRLFHQAGRLSASKLKTAFIIETGSKNFVSPEAVQGALISIGIVFGIPVFYSEGPAETAYIIYHAALQCERHTAEHYRRPGYRPRGITARKLFVLQGIPGIGPKRAKILLGHFGTIKNIITAPPAELLLVSGINKKTAQQMISLLHE
ncbi:MAG: hypothetical protein A2096_02055 [Spirochaetes bacterium GWF1_41_5]|nr:MAG: hypothetical protein A2096_02055 [Spirochaetes bacterium GWF1_41_5]HBE04237.1 hypothetical protein [Spirochaetia bacterium]